MNFDCMNGYLGLQNTEKNLFMGYGMVRTDENLIWYN